MISQDAAPDRDGTVGDVREFVAAATHDLRGLQAALRTAVNLLHSEAEDASREPLWSLLDRQTSRLGRLTDDMFLLSLSDTGRIEVHPDRVDLDPLLGDAVLESGKDAVLESGKTDVQVNSTAWLAVWADPTHVQRIVANLVRNAVRHGAPPIRVTAAAADHDQVEIRVSDAGPGVPAEFVPRLFGRFTRAGEAHGAGLGLSIVAELARLNGGSAHYQPPLPEQPGATFVVRLPQTARTLSNPIPSGSDDSLPGSRSDPQDVDAHRATLRARHQELAVRAVAVLERIRAVAATTTALHENVRESMRTWRRLLREGAALADSTPGFDRAARGFLDQASEAPPARTDPAPETNATGQATWVRNLAELRQTRAIPPAQIAAALGVDPPTVSAIEHTDDQLVSTVRAFVEALGGHLEITAVFDDQHLHLEAPTDPTIESSHHVATIRPSRDPG